MLDRLPQELDQKDRKRTVRVPQRVEGFKDRQTAEVFLLIEYIDRQRPCVLQFQQQRLMHMGGKVVKGQKGRHFLRIKRLGIQPDTEIFLKISLVCHSKIPEVRTDQQHGV